MGFSKKLSFILLSFLVLNINTYCRRARRVRFNRSGSCNMCGISHESEAVSKKIINGEEIQQENKYPWLVPIMTSGNIMCGGAIISPRYIMTAAHCFLKKEAFKDNQCQRKKIPRAPCYHPPERFQVGILNQAGTRTPVQVVRLIAHPFFSIKGKINDIGLMKLSRPIQCGKMSAPICLPKKTLHRIGTNLTVAGWGKFSENNTAEKVLREGRMTQVDERKCVDGNTTASRRHYVCAVATETNQKSCFGDSGSAIFTKYGKKNVALGVTSFGISQPNQLCSLDKPAIFTEIHPYRKWIRRHVKDMPRG